MNDFRLMHKLLTDPTHSIVVPIFSKTVFLSLLPLLLLVSACGQSDDQRDFEASAFSEADGFTQTDSGGEVISSDPDDWRIAPFFQGVVEVDPPFPNPVQSTDQFTLNIWITGVEAVNGIRIYAFYGGNNIRLVYEDNQRPMPTGLANLPPISAAEIVELPESPQGLYRIIVLDGDENVITYGDIRVD
jgi:hypothetical protein